MKAHPQGKNLFAKRPADKFQKKESRSLTKQNQLWKVAGIQKSDKTAAAPNHKNPY